MKHLPEGTTGTETFLYQKSSLFYSITTCQVDLLTSPTCIINFHILYMHENRTLLREAARRNVAAIEAGVYVATLTAGSLH